MQLIVTLNVPSLTASGKDHRAVETIDVWDELPVGIRTALTTLATRIETVAKARYGKTAVVESMKLQE